MQCIQQFDHTKDLHMMSMSMALGVVSIRNQSKGFLDIYQLSPFGFQVNMASNSPSTVSFVFLSPFKTKAIRA